MVLGKTQGGLNSKRSSLEKEKFSNCRPCVYPVLHRMGRNLLLCLCSWWDKLCASGVTGKLPSSRAKGIYYH